MHDYYDQATLCIDSGNLDDAVLWYSRAVQCTPTNDCEARLLSIACCNLGIFLSSHLHLQAGHRFTKDDNKAVLLFKVGAVSLKSPSCMYFYGHALAHGQGGVKENGLARSIHYLNQAGKERVGEAFYELGKIYEERGCSDGAGHSVNLDKISAAEEFYEAAKETYTFRHADVEDRNRRIIMCHTPPRGAWTPSCVTIRSLLHTEGWDALENAVSYGIAQRFSWAVAGQAFLFTGAVALFRGDGEIPVDTMPFLLILPILGVILAVYSFSETLASFSRMGTQRRAVIKMVLKKLEAHGVILEASINDPYYNIMHDYPDKDRTWEDVRADRFLAWENERRLFKDYLHQVSFLLFITRLTLHLAYLADFAFFSSWVVLLWLWAT